VSHPFGRHYLKIDSISDDLSCGRDDLRGDRSPVWQTRTHCRAGKSAHLAVDFEHAGGFPISGKARGFATEASSPQSLNESAQTVLITSVRFHNYKAFRQFSVSLSEFDVLVGPNNAGKSTVLGAFRVLSEGLRKANSRNAEFLQLPAGDTWGYFVDLRDVPVSLENVFHNYDDSELPRRIFGFRTAII
jgi:hypothetical protein